jgi:hypothetical protein
MAELVDPKNIPQAAQDELAAYLQVGARVLSVAPHLRRAGHSKHVQDAQSLTRVRLPRQKNDCPDTPPQEMRNDYNQRHFVRNESFKKAADALTGELAAWRLPAGWRQWRTTPHHLATYTQPLPSTGPTRKIFIEFLERSCTAEFSGFLLFKELGRRLKGVNPVVAGGVCWVGGNRDASSVPSRGDSSPSRTPPALGSQPDTALLIKRRAHQRQQRSSSSCRVTRRATPGSSTRR